MSNTQNSPSTSTFATITGWITTAPPWEIAALAGAQMATLIAAAMLLRRLGRTIRALRAADDEPIDPFTAAVTILATALSVDGMWTVFGHLHLVTPARVVSCGVLEASGFAFMRLARNDIKAGRPATTHTVIVWAIAILSGSLSAGASGNPIEMTVRLIFPSLAVQLLHSWFLPIPSEMTLTQRQKGKRVWRLVKARRRADRAKTKPTRWIAGQLLALEDDRLAKRGLMTGDATDILEAAEQNAKAEARAALKCTPSAPQVHPAPETDHAPRHRANRTYVAPRERTDEEILEAAKRVNAQITAATGAPASARKIANQVRIGQDRAREIRKIINAGA